jgi:two-component system phosphate regulon sensor histidine kinase PhoR
MAGVVRAAAAGLAPVCASRGIRLEVEVPAQLIVRGGDADELAAAVRNLVDNAVLHGGSGGLVRAALELHRGRRGDEARVSVSDRGPGIPRAELARLFEPFVRGSAAVAAQLPGSGLGLAIVDRAARRHGGTVMVESSPGRGTTFTIVLPLRRGRKV